MRLNTALVFFVGVGCGGNGSFVSVVSSSEITGAAAPLLRSIENVHESCLIDSQTRCLFQRDDPFDGFFSSIVMSQADPEEIGTSPFRTLFESDDPFLRLALTPPSMSDSPRLLSPILFIARIADDDESENESAYVDVNHGGDDGNVVVVDDDDVDLFACLCRALDGMMESAVHVATISPPLPPPPMMIESFSVLIGPSGEGDNVNGGEEGSAAAADTTQDPAIVAMSLFDYMVDGLLNHAASASASNDVPEWADGTRLSVEVGEQQQQQQQQQEEVVASPESADESGTANRNNEENARSRRSDEEGESESDEPRSLVAEVESLRPAVSSVQSQWDPVMLARKIAQRGRDILAEEEEKKRGDLRRRLTEEQMDDDTSIVESELRRRMARRLTEVVPFGHLSYLPRVIVIDADEKEEDPTPRLGFGYDVDQCLWSAYRSGGRDALSNGCYDALDAMETTFREGQKATKMTGTDSASSSALVGDAVPVSGFANALAVVLDEYSFFFFSTCAVLSVALLAITCIWGEDDEDDCEDGKEYGDNAYDYVLVEDLVIKGDDKTDGGDGLGKMGAEAFVGVPLRVV